MIKTSAMLCPADTGAFVILLLETYSNPYASRELQAFGDNLSRRSWKGLAKPCRAVTALHGAHPAGGGGVNGTPLVPGYGAPPADRRAVARRPRGRCCPSVVLFGTAFRMGQPSCSRGELSGSVQGGTALSCPSKALLVPRHLR